MAERSNAAALDAANLGPRVRGFESHSLRQPQRQCCVTSRQETTSGVNRLAVTKTAYIGGGHDDNVNT